MLGLCQETNSFKWTLSVQIFSQHYAKRIWSRSNFPREISLNVSGGVCILLTTNVNINFSWTSWSRGTFKITVAVIFMPFVCFPVLVGDLSYEAHVQTHGGGAPGESPVAPEDRVPQHPHTHLPHLSSASVQHQDSESAFGWSLWGPAPTAIYIRLTLALWQLTWAFTVRFCKQTCLHPSRHRPSIIKEHSVILWM